MLKAAATTLPKATEARNKPWMSEETMHLIEKKRQARISGDWNQELSFRKLVRKAMRKDKAIWLQGLAGAGDWDSLRRLKGERAATQTRLRNTEGHTVFSDERAETFAKHLETIRWCVRPVTLIPDSKPVINETLPVKRSEGSRVARRCVQMTSRSSVLKPWPLGQTIPCSRYLTSVTIAWLLHQP